MGLVETKLIQLGFIHVPADDAGQHFDKYVKGSFVLVQHNDGYFIEDTEIDV